VKFAAAMSAGLNQAAAAARKLYAAPERRARAVRSATRKSLQHTNSATGRIWTLSRSTPLQCRACGAGKPLSFVYDVADVFKFETVVPEAFRIAGQATRGRLAEGDPVGAVRRACRDIFRRTALLERLIPSIEEILAAGEIAPPEAPPEAQGAGFPDPEPIGDAGHRG
jgi:hypothetical protein